MSKKIKIWLIIATSLILVGCILFGVVMSMLKWNFNKLSSEKYETNIYEITEVFKNFKINSKSADIVFIPSKENEFRVECYENVKVKHSVSVRDNTLVIEAVDNRKWYDYISLNFGKEKITVYVPKGEYGELLAKTMTGDIILPNEYVFENIEAKGSTGDVKILSSVKENIKVELSTGDIELENIEANNIWLSLSTGDISVESVKSRGKISTAVSTGDVKMKDTGCINFMSSGSTGDVVLEKVIANKNFDIRRSTGHIKLNQSDAAEIFAKTSTGDIKGSLLSQKVFITYTDTGRVDVPKTTSGGKCELKTSTGDIKIDIK